MSKKKRSKKPKNCEECSVKGTTGTYYYCEKIKALFEKKLGETQRLCDGIES